MYHERENCLLVKRENKFYSFSLSSHKSLIKDLPSFFSLVLTHIHRQRKKVMALKVLLKKEGGKKSKTKKNDTGDQSRKE